MPRQTYHTTLTLKKETFALYYVHESKYTLFLRVSRVRLVFHPDDERWQCPFFAYRVTTLLFKIYKCKWGRACSFYFSRLCIHTPVLYYTYFFRPPSINFFFFALIHFYYCFFSPRVFTPFHFYTLVENFFYFFYTFVTFVLYNQCSINRRRFFFSFVTIRIYGFLKLFSPHIHTQTSKLECYI